MKKDLTLAEAVLEHAEKQPDKTAVFFKKQAVTYGELAKRMKAAARIMKNKYGVSRGDRVFQGQHIAEAGNTGNSFGSHIHFGVKDNGTFQNPRNYLPAR